MGRSHPIKIDILATSDTSLSTLFGLYDVLGSVGVAWENFVSGKPGKPMFDVGIVAAESRSLHLPHDVVISPRHSLDRDETTDIALVASFVVPTQSPLETDNERERDWLLGVKNRGTTIASACTGAIMLAETGMLDGWEATTHWAFRDLFRKYFPAVKLRLERDLCISGESGQLITSGGATSWQQLAMYIIARYCGIEQATNAAKFWRIPILEESQIAFASLAQSTNHDDHIVNQCQQWVSEHYADANPVTAMVERSGLAPTTFARRFKRATGFGPMEYVHRVRIEEAKKKLESSKEVVEDIGFDVGYEDPASFRRVFKRKVGLTPSVYRRRFGRSRFERLGLDN